MVIIEKDWKKYEAVEIFEKTQEEIQAEIIQTQSYIDKIKFNDIETLELLLEYKRVEQEVLDIAEQSNEIKNDEKAWLIHKIEILENELKKW